MKSILLLLVIIPGLCARAQDKKGPQVTEVSITYKLNPVRHSELPPSILDLNIQRLSGSRVILTWHTEAEIIKDGFEVERKKEGEVFTPIGYLPSKPDG